MMREEQNILVVDDDTDIATMIRIMLEYKGFAVTIASKPSEAKQVAASADFSLIIMDMLLSGVNGTDICKELKADPVTSSIPVIMISAHPNAREICIKAGADDFIAKPFDMYDLLNRIRQFTSENGRA
jgi:DNA-binding response OmpR family regulator